jgi:hypothetical protein
MNESTGVTRTRRRQIAGLLIGLLLYALSFGPVWASYLVRNQPAPQFLKLFYYPILWCLEHTPLQLPIVFYLYIWERLYGGH